MKRASKRIVVVEGREICYHLERKNVKNLNLRVRKDCSIFVSANETISCEEIDRFIFTKAPRILNAIDHFSEMEQYKPKPKQYVSGETFFIQGRGLRLQVSQAKKDSITTDGVYMFLEVRDINDLDKKRKLVNRFMDSQCKVIFNEVVEELYPLVKKHGVEKPCLKIRYMETRWGSCLVKKKMVTLNKRLLEVPRNCIEYVVMHELCHFIHPNHSKQFYSFMTMLMPDWKERKLYLDKNVMF